MLMFSHPVASDFLLLHGLQQDRLPCPSLSHSAQTHIHWVKYATQPSHPLPPSSPFVFNLSQHKDLFQLVGASHQVANALELQLKHQSFQRIFRVDFLYDWLGWSPCCPRDSQESSLAPQFESIISWELNLLYGSTLISTHDCWKNKSFDYVDFGGKAMSLHSKILSRFVIAFLPRKKCLLISWLWSPSTVILESKKIKSDTVYIFFFPYLLWSDTTICNDLSFLSVAF